MHDLVKSILDYLAIADTYVAIAERYGRSETAASEMAQAGRETGQLNTALVEMYYGAKEARQAVLDASVSLANELERRDRDSTKLLRFRHAVEVSDSIDELWPDLRAELERQTVRLEKVPEPDEKLVRKLKGFNRKLLLYLWKRGNVVRDELRENVWHDPETGDKAIDMAISRLNAELNRLNLRETRVESNDGIYYLKHPEK